MSRPLRALIALYVCVLLPSCAQSSQREVTAPESAPPAPREAAAASTNQGEGTPEQPSQTAVQSAIRSVFSAAKRCVAGADGESRAQIVFSSSGAVKEVRVTGWASENGASDCIRAALQAANVGAFSRPEFTTGLTLRP